MTKILSVIFVTLLFGLTCLGQVANPDIDESELHSFLDSITPVKVELCGIRTDSLNQLTPENFNEFLVRSVQLEKEDEIYLVNEFKYRFVIGDSIISSQCYNPNYAIRLFYRDGVIGLVGVSFQCHEIKDYNSRYQKNETTIRFLKVLRETFDKYNL